MFVQFKSAQTYAQLVSYVTVLLVFGSAFHPLGRAHPATSDGSMNTQSGSIQESFLQNVSYHQRQAFTHFRPQLLLDPNSETATTAEHLHNDGRSHLSLAPSPSESSDVQGDGTNETATPFSVRIDGNDYYGGMETLSINGHPSKVCHILNPCLQQDGTLLLPQWMMRYDELLDFHCGTQGEVNFSLFDTKPPSQQIQNFDLIGIRTPRLHMPFFLQDAIPAMISLEAAHRSLDDGLQRACYARSGRSCSDFPQIRGKNVRPAMLLDGRVNSIDESKSWVRQFIRLMTPRYASSVKELYWPDIFPTGERTADLKCFRSVYLTKGASAKTPIKRELFESLQLFKAHDVAKEKRDVFARDQDLETPTRKDRCSLNVTFLNRKPDVRHPNRALGRYIPNIPELRRALRKLAQRDTRIAINVHSLRLDGRSMRWQINAMQKTDLLVAGHGAALTNMIFMRGESSVLELQPFAYYPDTYRKIASRIANIRYAKHIAKPDGAAFRACMDHYYKSDSPEYTRAQDILTRFDRAAEAYNRSSTNTRWLLMHILNDSMPSVRTCAQIQRLDVDAKSLAENAFDLAKTACGIRGP
jgi:hypothetical protein